MDKSTKALCWGLAIINCITLLGVLYLNNQLVAICLRGGY